MRSLTSSRSVSPVSRLRVVGVMLIAFAVTTAQAQSRDADAPEAVFIDLQRQTGWGPFIPRTNYEPEHYVGTFAVGGKALRLYVLRHTDRGYEDRVLIEPAHADVPSAEGQGLDVVYLGESIDLSGVAYEVKGVSPVTQQYVLTKREDVQYAQYGLQRGDVVPSFLARSTDGEELSAAHFEGSYVLIHFWGTWCAPCHVEIPFLVEAHDRFGDRMRFVGVAVDDDEEGVREYVAEKRMTWPQINVPNSFPDTDEFVSAFGVRGYPTIYLIGPDGRILLGRGQERRLRGAKLAETLTRVVYGAHK